MHFLTKKETSLLLRSLQKNGEKKSLEISNQKKKYKREESQLVKACIQYLTLKGYLPIRNNSGMIILNENKKRAIKMGTPGSPDIIACEPGGKFVAIECKSKTGRISKAQINFLNKVKQLGGKSFVIKSIDELITLL